MKKLYKVVLIALSISLMLSIIACSNSDKEKETFQDNNSKLISALKTLDKNEFTLGELTSFQWDEAFLFTPYANKKGIELSLGIKSDIIVDSIDDTQYQLFFIKDNEIVAYINGKEQSSFSFKYPMAISIPFQPITPETRFVVERQGELAIYHIGAFAK